MNLNYQYDAQTDVLTIEGIRYSGTLFRQLGGLLPLHTQFVITSRGDGVIVLEESPPIVVSPSIALEKE